MFESAELGHQIDKRRYHRELPKLRSALLDAQYELKQAANFPVILVMDGVDGAGRSETVNALHDWLDARLLSTHAFGPATEEERARPRMWRYWSALPAKGQIGIWFSSWYAEPLAERVAGRMRGPAFDSALEEIARTERMLADSGALILKFWMHLSKSRQKKRFEALESDPLTRWRVTKADWANFERYDKLRKASERAIRHTNSSSAPWIVIEGEDRAYRELAVGQTLLAALRARLDLPATRRPPAVSSPAPAPIDGLQQLDALDLTLRLSKPKYERALAEWQGKLSKATRRDRFRQRSVVVLFEGPDAAGKGGAIRRLTAAMDARIYHVVPIAAPNEEERAQPYLWRFWRHLPGSGQLTIFDRSWYGRVLVERVEELASADEWQRAYAEINDFEHQLSAAGIVVVKFWLAISKSEQEKRFAERKKTSFKRYKITAEDYRNRKKWSAYERAANDMFERTSTSAAPWTLVAAEDKHFARVKVLETLVTALADAVPAVSSSVPRP